MIWAQNFSCRLVPVSGASKRFALLGLVELGKSERDQSATAAADSSLSFKFVV